MEVPAFNLQTPPTAPPRGVTLETSGTQGTLHTPGNNSESTDEFASQMTEGSVYPWWPAAAGGTPPMLYYHTTTRLLGKLSMIVDIGAWTNLMGSNMARASTARALSNGHNPRQDNMFGALTIQGVGEGSQKCTWEIHAPIAAPHNDGAARMHKITSPIVEGSGADLPGLLGCRSLEHERSIVDTGNKMLHFLGKGEAQIILPPGSCALPLQQAPSGHLVVEIDAYEKVRPYRGGLPDISLQLHATDEAATLEARPKSPGWAKVPATRPERPSTLPQHLWHRTRPTTVIPMKASPPTSTFEASSAVSQEEGPKGTQLDGQESDKIHNEISPSWSTAPTEEVFTRVNSPTDAGGPFEESPGSPL